MSEIPITAERRRNAMILAAILPIISLCGVGHMYIGKVGLGIGILFIGWIFLALNIVVPVVGLVMFMIVYACGLWDVHYRTKTPQVADATSDS